MKKVISFVLVIMMMLSLCTVTGVSADTMTSGDYEYEMYDKASVKIVKYKGGAAEKLTIPEYLGGYPVKAIGESAFEQAEIYGVVLPSSLEVIEDFAFLNTGISSVTLPKKVSSVGVAAFAGGLFTEYKVDKNNPYFCTDSGVLFSKDKKVLVSYPVAKSTRSYNVPEGVETIGDYAFYLAFELRSVDMAISVMYINDGAFYASSVEHVALRKNCQWVGHYAFANCDKFSSLDMMEVKDFMISPYALENSWLLNNHPDGMLYYGSPSLNPVPPIAYYYKGIAPKEFSIAEGTKRINGKAFALQPELKTLTIPASITEIDLSAFDECYALENIVVAEDNENYASVDGMLYNKDKTELLVCPAGKSGVVTVPEGTEYVEDYAFEYCDKITEVVFPQSLEAIGELIFYGCKSLEKTVIPDSIKSFAGGAFYECESLVDITIPEGSTLFCDLDFYDSGWYKAQPDGILYLCNNALGYKGDPTGIKTLEFQEGTKAIGFSAFFGFTDVTSVVLPDSIEAIGEYAFADCTGLKEITVPSSVDEIGAYALGFRYEYNEETDEEKHTPVEGFVIKGYDNSAAQMYAGTHGFKFESLGAIEVSDLLGDVDLDERITIKDATCIQKYIASLSFYGTQALRNSDFNLDGTINIKDATAIQKLIAGLEY